MTDKPERQPPAAAIVGDRSQDIDALLTRIVREQQARGRRLRGCVMKRPQRSDGVRSMVLVDVERGTEYLVSQPMGKESRGCRADPQGFARASEVFRQALADAPDLVVCNRYGELEVRGEGFADELLTLMMHGIPVLTTVAERNAPAWSAFTGGGQVLPLEVQAIEAWIEAACGAAADEEEAQAPGR